MDGKDETIHNYQKSARRDKNDIREKEGVLKSMPCQEPEKGMAKQNSQSNATLDVKKEEKAYSTCPA